MQALLAAIVAIVNADTGMAALTGRTAGAGSRQIVTWSDLDDAPDTVVAYLMLGAAVTGADNDTRRPQVRFSCFAKDLQTAYGLADRLEAILTAPALQAQGVDVTPLYPEQLDNSQLEDVARLVRRVDLEILFDGTQ